MRTVQDLIDDLGRLDGTRLDETVFELFHRGPRALDRLWAYWESDATVDVQSRIRASMQSQWMRLQEVLVDMAPRALGSTGARWAISMGSAESLARRAQRCIDQGRLDTAAAIASALAASATDGVERAVLESRIALAVGRPDQAMSRLGGYCRATPPAPSHSAALEWFARAAQDAGRPVEAFLSRLHLEPDVGASAEIIMCLADADDRPGLASCIAEVARSGDKALWTMLAESAAAALDDALGVHTGLVTDLLGMGGQIESMLDTIESVIADMEASMPTPAELSVARELVSLASDARDILSSARRLHSAVRGLTGDEGSCEGSSTSDTMSLLLGVTDPMPRCDHDSDSSVWTWSFRGRPPREALSRARLTALMHGASWRAFWKNGEFVVSVSLPSLPSSSASPPPSASTLPGPTSGLDASAIERILKSMPPQEAAESLIHSIRSVQVRHARSMLDEACRALAAMAGALGPEGDMPCDPGSAPAGIGRAVAEIRDQMERRSRRLAGASGSSEDADACAHMGADAEGRPRVAAADEWSLPEELDCSPEAYQALRTAHLLIAGLGPEELLPPEQAGLPAFLLQKAVQIEAERRLGDALAVHRLKPRALAATRDRGKRRRELDPDFVRNAVSRAPRGISPDRVRGGLERLTARILDGSSRPLTGDLFLAGLALAYLDPLGDPERSVALGSALLAMGEAAATTAAGNAQGSLDLRRMEQVGIEALLAMSPFGGREGR